MHLGPDERVRLWYDKKCVHLRSHDANSAEPFALKTTRAAIRTSGPSSASPSPPSTPCPRGLSPRNNELLPTAVGRSLLSSSEGACIYYSVLNRSPRTLPR
ncbi:hypothetical protein VPH35_129832 [Triticum aestivum]